MKQLCSLIQKSLIVFCCLFSCLFSLFFFGVCLHAPECLAQPISQQSPSQQKPSQKDSEKAITAKDSKSKRNAGSQKAGNQTVVAPVPNTLANPQAAQERNRRLQNLLNKKLAEGKGGGSHFFGASGPAAIGADRSQLADTAFLVYTRNITKIIKSNWTWKNKSDALTVILLLSISRSGAITAVKVDRGSGSGEFDASTIKAVELSSPLPPPPSHLYSHFEKVRITFDPREELPPKE